MGQQVHFVDPQEELKKERKSWKKVRHSLGYQDKSRIYLSLAKSGESDDGGIRFGGRRDRTC